MESLRQRGHEVVLYGPLASEPLPWPDVAQAVASGDANEGVLCCWTGTGVSIAANKVPGVRAALWNDANVLCLSLRRTSEVIAGEILDAWFGTAYQPNPDDDACIARVREIEAKHTRPR